MRPARNPAQENSDMTKFIAILIGPGALAQASAATSDGGVEIDTNGDGVLDDA